MKNYQLTNEQRKYFGLHPVDEQWDKVNLNENIILFFEQTKILRIITLGGGYQEYDCEIVTIERNTIVPKTNRGKEKKLTSANVLKLKGAGVLFSASFYKEGYIKAVNLNTEETFAKRFDEEMEIRSFDDLDKWVNNYIQNSPKNHFEWLNNVLSRKRKNIKIKPGDIFAFKVARFTYAFARVLVYLPKIRKDKYLHHERHGMKHVMGTSMLILPYTFLSETPKTAIDALIKKPALPSCYIMDNNIFYGEYPVIGNRKLEASDLDFPISFGKTIYQLDVYYLQWGFAHLEKESSGHLQKLANTATDSILGFRKDGAGFGVSYNLTDIENKMNDSKYWDFIATRHDLRNPKYATTRKKIFEAFGLTGKVTYEDACLKANAPSLKDTLEYLNK